ncbi:hypothetical protein SGFS_076100 [Streptomyces graminofaciens]|uniref:Uncharacterized protein n=1 Tax=Streptomyces graminofaciens TaxID=68212 RepID=A0ABM7FJ93_9ACTN|nr:hypothetical protein SGFS_076100 [Streptomyces graminofaciens]
MTTISRTRSPIASHVDQFSSTQLAALVALSWASWSEGTAGVVEVSEGEGDGDGDSAASRADRDDADDTGDTAVPPGAISALRYGGQDPSDHGKVTERADPPH